MRACLTSALAVVAAVVISLGSFSGSASAADGCNSCGKNGCGKHHQHKYYEGRDRGFNCGCNGSYNYPVPPLYTYHWPGMYKAERMTDYHSPWRFPPLKPFMDEVVPPVGSGTSGDAVPRELQPITALMPIRSQATNLGQPESMSSKLLRSFR